MSKVLILESDWRLNPTAAPTEQRSTAKLYCTAVAAETAPLLTDTWRQTIQRFVRQPDTRRGVNLIILSSHGNNLAHKPVLAAGDGLIDDFSGFGSQLKRSILILDACYLGSHAETVQQHSGALGVIGFAGQVNWTASSVLILALLRYYQRHGVLSLQRCSGIRPQQVLARLTVDYDGLAMQLGVNRHFR